MLNPVISTKWSRDVGAVLAASDTMALGALRASCDLGLDVPQDVAVVGFDRFAIDRLDLPDLTTVGQPVRVTAVAVVAMLLGRIADQHAAPSAEPLAEVPPVDLVLGSTPSVGAPKPTSPGPRLAHVRNQDPLPVDQPTHRMEAQS